MGFFDPTPDVNFAHVCSHQPTRAWFYLKLALTPTMRELTIGWHYFRDSTVVFIKLRRGVGRSEDLRGRTPLLPLASIIPAFVITRCLLMFWPWASGPKNSFWFMKFFAADSSIFFEFRHMYFYFVSFFVTFTLISYYDY